MSLTLITPPPVKPISVAEAKAQLRIDTADDDARIGALIAAAVQHIDGRDGWMNRAFVQQTWELRLDAFPWIREANRYGSIILPLPPLRSVDSVSYRDSAHQLQVWDPSNYDVDLGGDWKGRITPKQAVPWPQTDTQPDAVIVRFTAGYAPVIGSPTDYLANIPETVRQALLLLVSHWYENRAPVLIGRQARELPMAVQALLAPLRVVTF